MVPQAGLATIARPRPCLPGRRMEDAGLGPDPRQEVGQCRFAAERLEFSLGEARMDRAMADLVKQDGVALCAALQFWHEVVPTGSGTRRDRTSA